MAEYVSIFSGLVFELHHPANQSQPCSKYPMAEVHLRTPWIDEEAKSGLGHWHRPIQNPTRRVRALHDQFPANSALNYAAGYRQTCVFEPPGISRARGSWVKTHGTSSILPCFAAVFQAGMKCMPTYSGGCMYAKLLTDARTEKGTDISNPA